MPGPAVGTFGPFSPNLSVHGTIRCAPATCSIVSCDQWFESISAIADGEVSPIDERLVDAHVGGCPICREFRSSLELTRARLRLRAASSTPDLSGRIVKLNAIADRASRWSVLRAVLAIVAVEVIVFSLPALVLGRDEASTAHAARHLGAFTIAYGVGLLVVVVRPARARAMLPVAAVLALALSLSAIVDLSAGQVPLVGEATHLPELISVALLWLLARPAPAGLSGSQGHLRGTRRALRLVDETDRSEAQRLAGGER